MRTVQWSLSPHQLVQIRHFPQLTRFKDLVRVPNATTTTEELPPIFHAFHLIESIMQTLRLIFARVQYLLTHGKDTTNGRRQPLVVMVHLSSEARSPLTIILTGFIQGLTLLVLTAFFGIYWGGTVIDTLKLLIILLATVTLGRLLGVVYVQWSSQAFGLTVIECYNKDEIRGVLRLLASMPDVLVEINGAQYLWGTRVDGHTEFRRWLISVEKGQFDDVGQGLGGDLHMPDETYSKNPKFRQKDEPIKQIPTEFRTPQPDSLPLLPILPQRLVPEHLITDNTSSERI